MLPSGAVSVDVGSSSSTMCTIGVDDRVGPVDRAGRLARQHESDTGETNRKKSHEDQRRRGQGRQERCGRPPRARTAPRRPRPTSDATAIGRAEPADASPSGGSTSAAVSSAISARCTAQPSPRRTRPAAHTSARAHAAAARAHSRARARRCRRRVPARDEELRVIAEQPEHRLHERERPQSAEVQGGAPVADGRPPRRFVDGARGIHGPRAERYSHDRPGPVAPGAVLPDALRGAPGTLRPMRIIVLGAGHVGRAIVDALYEEHEITVIDTNAERLQALADRYDVRDRRGQRRRPSG